MDFVIENIGWFVFGFMVLCFINTHGKRIQEKQQAEEAGTKRTLRPRSISNTEILAWEKENSVWFLYDTPEEILHWEEEAVAINPDNKDVSGFDEYMRYRERRGLPLKIVK